MPASMGRPKGVTFLGWFNALVGALCVIASFAPQAGASAVPLLAAGVFSVIVGIGLLSGQRWAWGLAIVCYALNFVAGFVKINPITIVVSALILGYLCSTQVQTAFSKRRLPAQQPVQIQGNGSQEKAA